MKIRFSSASAADIHRLAAFLDEVGATTSAEAIDVIRRSALSLRSFPDRGAPIGPPGVRRLTILFGRAAYLLDYRVDRERQTVTILRVRHSREGR